MVVCSRDSCGGAGAQRPTLAAPVMLSDCLTRTVPVAVSAAQETAPEASTPVVNTCAAERGGLQMQVAAQAGALTTPLPESCRAASFEDCGLAVESGSTLASALPRRRPGLPWLVWTLSRRWRASIMS